MSEMNLVTVARTPQWAELRALHLIVGCLRKAVAAACNLVDNPREKLTASNVRVHLVDLDAQSPGCSPVEISINPGMGELGVPDASKGNRVVRIHDLVAESLRELRSEHPDLVFPEVTLEVAPTFVAGSRTASNGVPIEAWGGVQMPPA